MTPRTVGFLLAALSCAVVVSACGGHKSDDSGAVGDLYFDMQGHPEPTASQAEKIGRHAQLVVGTPAQLTVVGQDLLRHNPHLQVYVYLNGMLSPPGQAQFPNSWYMTDKLGRKIQAAKTRAYLMNPRSTAVFDGAKGWTAYVGQSCANALKRVSVARGCYLDMLGPAPLLPSYNVGHSVPVTDGTKAPITSTEYLAETGGLATTVASITKAPIAGNGLVSGPAYFAATKQLAGHVPLLEAERWMGFKTGDNLSVGPWLANVKMLQAAKSEGTNVLVNYRAPVRDRDRLHEFAYASFLLGASSGDLFQFGPHGLGGTPPTPYEAMSLGTPTGGFAESTQGEGQVYERKFTDGLVLVNPAQTSVTVNVSSGYQDASGEPVNSIDMPGHSGAVLSASS